MVGNLKLFCGDSYELVDTFLRNNLQVDHIITDPPYNISKENNFDKLRNPRAGVDFGSWDRGEFDLYSWILPYSRLIKKDGAFIIFCSYRNISNIIERLESPQCGFVVKDVLVWQKSNPMPRNVNRRYVQDMEFAIWAVRKNAKWTFNKPADKPYLRALFTTSLVSGNERLDHPTQKSLRLMQQIISIHTNEEDLILDPFMGSGTTGEAALRQNRRFVGVEREPNYFAIAEKRLSKFQNLLCDEGE